MKSLTIWLPDIAFAQAEAEAKTASMEASALCSGILADHFLARLNKEVISHSVNPPIKPVAPDITNRIFNVAEYFPNFPSGSIRFAQTFVDEALKFHNVRAFPKTRGIGFDPNFVFIEYLTTRGGKAGLGVSFYGEPHRHQNPPPILRRGIPSYSRAKIESDEDLQKILPHIRQSYELKFGI